MKRDYSNLPEHLPVGKLAFNDSTNELFIGAGDDSPPQKVTDMDIHDELNQASIDYSGEHHENLKDSMDANVDFIMGEFNSTQMTGEFITAQNTLPRHIKRAELRGHTEVNLIQEPSGQDLVLPYEFEDTQSLTLEDTKESGAVNIVLKGNTEVNVLKNPVRDYVVPYEFEEGYDVTLTDTKETGSVKSAILKGQTLVNLATEFTVVFTGGNQWKHTTINQNLLSLNKKYIVFFHSSESYNGYIHFRDTNTNTYITTPTVGGFQKGYNYCILNHFAVDDLSQYAQIKITFHLNNGETVTPTLSNIVAMEYQEGMENWDIPYFEGMQSVKLPVLTTTGKNLYCGKNSIGFISDSTGIVNPSGVDWLVTDFVKVERNKTYTFSEASIFNGLKKVAIYDSDKKFLTMSNTLSFTPSENGYARFNVKLTTGGNVTDFVNQAQIQIEEGSNATSYEPHKTNILSINEDVALRGIGDVKDTLDLVTGEYVQRIGEVVLDGSENWATHGYGYCLSASHLGMYHRTISNNQVANNFVADSVPTVSIQNLSTLTIDGIAPSHKQYKEILLFVKEVGKSNLNGLKQWLSQNPITVQYELATESIKTVDLTVQDQDGLSVPALSTYNEVTYLSASSQEGSLRPLITSKIPEFPVMIKPSTKYSIVADTTENGHEAVPLTYNLGGAEIETEIGNKVIVITTPSTLTNETFKVTGTGMKLSNVMILEKDLTGKELPNYTEGMQSVKMSVLTTTGKNLFDGNLINGYYEDGTLNKIIGGNENIYKTIKLNLKKGTYTFSFEESVRFIRQVKDGVYEVLGGDFTKFTTTLNTDGIYVLSFRKTDNTDFDLTHIQVEQGSIATSYEPYKTNILTVNEPIELGSVGNVYDTLDLLTGKVIKRTETYTYKGETEPYLNSSIGGYVIHVGANANVTLSTGIISDKFINRSFTNNDTGVYGNNNGAFYFFDKLVTSAQEFKEKYIGTTFRFELKEESVKTVDLNIINQNGQKVDKLSTFNGVTYVESSVAENSLKPIISHKDLEYEVLLKPNTKYSIITNPVSNGHTNSPISFDLGGQQVETTVGSYCTLVTTPSTLTHDKLVMKGKGNKLSGGVMIFEGDKTGMMFNHFDGMKSVEDFTVRVTNKNLFTQDVIDALCTVENWEGTGAYKQNYKAGRILGLKPNTQYTVKIPTIQVPPQSYPILYFVYAGDIGISNGTILASGTYSNPDDTYKTVSERTWIFTTPNALVGLRCYVYSFNQTNMDKLRYVLEQGIQIEESTKATTFNDSKQNSASFKIPMRSLPNGVYDTLDLITGEYVQRVGEIVLDGSETWHKESTNDWSGDTDTTSCFYSSISDIVLSNSTLNCQLFSCYPNTIYNKQYDFEGIAKPLSDRRIFIRINQSRLTTLDSKGFKQWLSENPVTLQYQLEKPIVTKLDLAWEDGKLFAYDGTTHFFVDVDGGHLQPVLDIDVPVNIVAELSRLRAEKEQLESYNGQLENQLSLLSLRNSDLQSNVQSLVAENSQLKLSTQDLQTRSNVLQLKNKELKQHQEKLQAENVELQERASQLTQATENLTEGLHTVDAVRESGDLELLSSDFDLDFRLMEIEFALDIATPMSLFKGVKTMARTPYEMAKTLILGGKYDRADMEYKLGRYLERKQLTQEQYDELMALIEATDLVG